MWLCRATVAFFALLLRQTRYALVSNKIIKKPSFFTIIKFKVKRNDEDENYYYAIYLIITENRPPVK